MAHNPEEYVNETVLTGGDSAAPASHLPTERGPRAVFHDSATENAGLVNPSGSGNISGPGDPVNPQGPVPPQNNDPHERGAYPYPNTSVD